MKKKIASGLLISFVLSILIAGALWCTAPQKIVSVRLPQDTENLYPKGEYYITGYERSGIAYTPNSDDPQIGLVFSAHDICTIIVEFGKPLEQDLPIQVYYAVGGQELSENNSFHTNVKEGNSYAVIKLNSAAYTQIRLDINGPFELNNIFATTQHPTINYNRTFPNICMCFLIAWCISFVAFTLMGCISEPTVRMKQQFTVLHTAFSNLLKQKSKSRCGFIVLELFFISNVLQAICLYKPVNQDPLNGALFPISIIAVWGTCVMTLILWHFGGANSRKLMLFWCVAIFFSAVAAINLNVQINVRLVLYAVVMTAVWLIGPLLFEKEDVCAIAFWMKTCAARLIPLGLSVIASCGLGIAAELMYSRYTGKDWVWGKALFFFVAIFVVFVSVVFHKAFVQKPEKFFLLIALSVGLYMCVTIPIATLVSWDDEIHYEKTVFLSQSDSAVFTDADISIIQRYPSRSLSESQNQENRYTLQQQYIEGSGTVRKDEQALSLLRVGYLPSAMGVWLGKILNAPFACVYMFGRIGNLLFYSVTMYFAIKKLSSGKILLLIIGLIPTNLFLASSYSYDTWVIALTALGFSYFFSALQRPEEKLTCLECAVMMGALFLASLPKLVYLILIIILLTMPRQKFSSSAAQKKYRVAVCVCIIAAVILLLQTYFMTAGFSSLTDVRGGSEVNARGQLIYVFSHPFAYAKILFGFLWSYIHPENSADYMTFFAYMGATGKHTILFAMLCVAALTDYQTEGLEKHPYLRIFAAITLFTTVAVIASALYVSFTPVAHTTINGCQPRYLLPLIFPFFALVFSHYKVINANWLFYRATFYVLNFCCVFSTIWWIIASQIVP